MALFSMTLSDPTYPIFDTVYRFLYLRSGWR